MASKKMSPRTKAELELYKLAKRFPGMGIKSHSHPQGYLRGISSAIGARKAIRKSGRKRNFD